MNKTPNYQLNQWEASDKVQRVDFNADNAKIDAALSALSSGKGNCRIETGSYEGDKSATRTITITAGFQPKVVVVVGNHPVFMFQGAPIAPYSSNGTVYEFQLTWSGNSVSWQVRNGRTDIYLNERQTYRYVIFG